MGACNSRAAVAPEKPPSRRDLKRTYSIELPETRRGLTDLEQAVYTALLDFREIKYTIKGGTSEDPFLLTLAFINQINAKRATIQGLLTSLAVEGSTGHPLFRSYFLSKDASLKEELQKRFRDGRVRVAAETMRVNGVAEMLMPGEKGGSAHF